MAYDGHNNNCVFTETCHQCGLKIRGCDSACHAMGNLYHARCFICSVCGVELKGQAFYLIDETVYCTEDYKKTKRHENLRRCYSCREVIGERILETIGRSYHPGCFRCSECNRSLDGVPFTVDNEEVVYCVPDYHRKYSPRCDSCKQPIIPQKESDEIVRILCLGKQFHEKCFKCEGCGIQLSNEEGNQCYPLDRRLYCLKCNEHRQLLKSTPSSSSHGCTERTVNNPQTTTQTSNTGWSGR